MNDKRILVAGGTGRLGAPVVRALLAARRPVRLLARKPEAARAKFGDAVEIAPGDVEDEASILRALDGCSGVHISVAAGMDPAMIDRIEHLGTAWVARAAARVGVERLSPISGGSTSDEPIWDVPKDRGMTSVAKSRADHAIRESGVS